MKFLETKVWRDVKGYEGSYLVSNSGEVKSLLSNKILKQTLDGAKGYLKVGLSKNGKVKTFRVHRLVAEAFLPITGVVVNHIDGNKLNNHVANLEWVSHSENNQHAYDNGLKPNKCKKFTAISPTGKEYEFEKQIDASRFTGVSTAYISGCLKGKYKSAKGWLFQRFP